MPGGYNYSLWDTALGESRPWEEGDIFQVDICRTFWNTLKRGVSETLSLEREDLEVYSPELLSDCATVLMLDMSGSMERFNKFEAAKRAALALYHPITTRFPRDDLYIIGFYAFAHMIPPGELPYAKPRHFDYNAMAERFSSSWALGGFRWRWMFAGR